jgi:uncharacterized protein (TIGR03437 family)
MPGEIIVLYANGFGTTSIPVVSGSVLQSGSLSPFPAITIGGLPATVLYAGLVAPGEFQFNVVVPASLGAGDQPITAAYRGFSTQAGAMITIQ